MSTTSVKVSAKHQVTIPQIVRKRMNIKEGDRLLLDVQDGVIVLTPEPECYADRLQGLHSEIWEGIDVRKYLNEERQEWTNLSKE